MKRFICLLLCFVLLGAGTAAASADSGLEIRSVACTAREDGLHDVNVVVAAEAGKMFTLLVAGNADNGVSNPMDFPIGAETKNGYVYYCDQGTAGEDGSCHFEFAMQIPEEMKNLTDYIYVFSGDEAARSASYAVGGVNHEITLEIGVNGKAEIGGTQHAGKGTTRVVDGGQLTLDLLPDDGYVVDKAFCGEQEMVVLNNRAATPKLTADAVVTVTFKEDIRKPEVTSFENPFFMEDGSITFGAVTLNNKGWTILECGVVYSKTNSEPEVAADGCSKLSAVKEVNAKGQFGIAIKGAADVLGASYYTRTYAQAEKDGKTEIFYGKTVPVTK